MGELVQYVRFWFNFFTVSCSCELYPVCLIFFLLIHLQHDSQVRVHWKGAAKTILASCQWYMDKDNIAAMDQERVINLPEIKFIHYNHKYNYKNNNIRRPPVIFISLVLFVFFVFFFLRYFILKKSLMKCPKKDCAVLPLPTELLLTKHSQTYLKATSCYWLSLV